MGAEQRRFWLPETESPTWDLELWNSKNRTKNKIGHEDVAYRGLDRRGERGIVVDVFRSSQNPLCQKTTYYTNH